MNETVEETETLIFIVTGKSTNILLSNLLVRWLFIYCCRPRLLFAMYLIAWNYGDYDDYGPLSS